MFGRFRSQCRERQEMSREKDTTAPPRPAAPAKAAIKSAAPELTKDLKALEKKLIDEWKSAEDRAIAVYILVAEAEKTKLYLARDKKTLTEYLAELLACGLRTAQYLVLIAKFFTKHQLPAKAISSLPASAVREMATYAFSSNAKRDAVIALIDQYKERGWTTEELRQTLQKRLENQRTASRAKGQGKSDESIDLRKVRSLRFSDEMWETVQESNSWIRAITNSDDLPQNMVWSMVELANMAKTDPQGALTGMITLIDLARKDFSNLQTAALKADEARKATEARRLFEQLASGAFVQMVIAGQFINGDGDFSEDFPDLAFKVG